MEVILSESIFTFPTTSHTSNSNTETSSSEPETSKTTEFEPLQSNIYCRLVPSSYRIPSDSKKVLSRLKANLGKSVLLHDIRSGFVQASLDLQLYVTLYGKYFAKQDLIIFVKLHLEVLNVCNTDPYVVKVCCDTLCELLDDINLTKKSDLLISWRNWFNLYKIYFLSSESRIGIFKVSESVQESIESAIVKCRYYFSISSTSEMLSEWLPNMCPFDDSLETYFRCFNLFLMRNLPAEYEDKSWKLWLSPFMSIWQGCGQNCANWEEDLMELLAGLSSGNCGIIDWEPYMNFIYSKIWTTLNLPLGYKGMNRRNVPDLSWEDMATWMVYVIGSTSSGKTYLRNLFTSIYSYYHHNNTGYWTSRLFTFASDLTTQFCKRLYREKYVSNAIVPTPEESKLTEDDITDFVDIMKPVAMYIVKGNAVTDLRLKLLNNLAHMRPEMIVPEIIVKLIKSVGGIDAEQENFVTAMECAMSVALPTIRGIGLDDHEYSEGKVHIYFVLPLLLNGIDSNDFDKTITAFKLISTYVSIVPMVDFSNVVNEDIELSETEIKVRADSLKSQDFVLQLIDQCFSLAENSTADVDTNDAGTNGVDLNDEEYQLIGALLGTFVIVLSQSSDDIFLLALSKVKTYVIGKIPGSKLSESIFCQVCQAFSRVNPDATLDALLPSVCKLISDASAADEGLQMEENISNELRFNLNLLSKIYQRSSSIIKYIPEIQGVLDFIIHMKCKEVQNISIYLLYVILCSFNFTYPTEFKSTPYRYNESLLTEHPINEWGVSEYISTSECYINWHIPTLEEKICCQMLVEKYLHQELDYLVRFDFDAKGKDSKEELQQRLDIVFVIIMGCKIALPSWSDEEPLIYDKSAFSVVEQRKSEFYLDFSDGRNILKSVFSVLDKLQGRLEVRYPDNVTAFSSIADLYSIITLKFTDCPHTFITDWLAFNAVKSALKDPIIQNKCNIRQQVVDNVNKHKNRLLEVKEPSHFTSTHLKILQNLLRLCTCSYLEVRLVAQDVFADITNKFKGSFALVLDHVLQILRSNESTVDNIKGALHVLKGRKGRNSMIVTRNWGILYKIWPSLISCPYSEKQSIHILLSELLSRIQNHLENIPFKPDNLKDILELPRSLWMSFPKPDLPIPNSVEILNAKTRYTKWCNDESIHYRNIIYILLQKLENPTSVNSGDLIRIHSFLQVIIQTDPLPVQYLEIILNGLLNDSPSIRNQCLLTLSMILRQQKVKYLRRYRNSDLGKENFDFGVRSDNEWLQYNPVAKPRCQKDWDEPRFIHKVASGYFTWTAQIELYSPRKLQSFETFETAERPDRQVIYKFFSSQKNVNKLMELLYLGDEVAGNFTRFAVFKGLFKNYEDSLLPVFKSDLDTLMDDNLELGNTLCLVELMAAIISAMKHWSFDRSEVCWTYLTPLLRKAMSDVTSETDHHFASYMATACSNRDPNKYSWFYEIFLDNPIRDEDRIYITEARLLVAQSILSQQQWRVEEPFIRILEITKSYVSHDYGEIRDRLGGILCTIYNGNIDFGNGKSPLKYLNASDRANTAFCELNNALPKILSEEIPDSKTINLMKTIASWIKYTLTWSVSGFIPEFLQFLPILCTMEHFENDTELSNHCTEAIGCLGNSLLKQEHVNTFFVTVRKCKQMPSWKARVSLMEYFQIAIISNVCTFKSNEEWKISLLEIVKSWLEDSKLECQAKASEVLSGLIHTSAAPDNSVLLQEFYSHLELFHTKQDEPKFYATILGLCSFVKAYPYDFPEDIPNVLLTLTGYVHSPRPCGLTVEETVNSFLNLHCDDWKQSCITQQEWDVLVDAVRSPEYYC